MSISTRDAFLKIGEYLRAVRRRWWVVILGGGLAAAVAVGVALTDEPKFEAVTSFVINQDQAVPGGFGGVLGTFGLGANAVSDDKNPNRIISYATSRTLIMGVLLDSVDLGGRGDLFINHVIEACELIDEFELGAESKYPTRLNSNIIDSMNRYERSLLKRVYRFVIQPPPGGLLGVSVSEISGIFSITALSPDEPVSLHLSKSVYQRLSAFYTLESVGPARLTVERLGGKIDSIQTELNQTEYALARLSDTRLGIVNRQGQLQAERLNRKLQILNLAYAQLVQNYETARFTLATKSPFFQLTEEPFTPLTIRRHNALRLALLWGIIGIILTIASLVFTHYYHSIMHPVSSIDGRSDDH